MISFARFPRAYEPNAPEVGFVSKPPVSSSAKNTLDKILAYSHSVCELIKRSKPLQSWYR